MFIIYLSDVFCIEPNLPPLLLPKSHNFWDKTKYQMTVNRWRQKIFGWPAKADFMDHLFVLCSLRQGSKIFSQAVKKLINCMNHNSQVFPYFPAKVLFTCRKNRLAEIIAIPFGSLRQTDSEKWTAAQFF